MFGIRRRIEGAGPDLETIAKAIESGATIGGEPSSIIAAVGLAGLGRELGPPLIQGPPSRPGLLRAASEDTLTKLLPKANRPEVLVLSAGLSQILDAWEPSHEAAQLADDLGEVQFSAYWHAIAHRREPDPGNAAYWFRRVGSHPVQATLAKEATPMLEFEGVGPAAKHLITNGTWDAMEFIRFCGDAAKHPGSPPELLARRLQRLEMLLLLDATCQNI